MENFLDKLVSLATQVGSKILLALVVFIIGRFIIKRLVKWFAKSKAFAKMDPTASKFLLSTVKIVLNAVLIVSIIGILGVPMASVVTVIASCGVAVGLALQGALSNLAGSIMLLIFRPFKVGDFILAAGEEGTVKEITMFYTILTTLDNKRVTIPNGALMNANVTNVSAEDLRRVDLTFKITGDAAIESVQEVMLAQCNANEKVLKDPAPFAAPVSGVPGGLEYTVRAWTEKANYWDVYFALLKSIATALGEAGIGGPVPPTAVKIDKE